MIKQNIKKHYVITTLLESRGDIKSLTTLGLGFKYKSYAEAEEAIFSGGLGFDPSMPFTVLPVYEVEKKD